MIHKSMSDSGEWGVEVRISPAQHLSPSPARSCPARGDSPAARDGAPVDYCNCNVRPSALIGLKRVCPTLTGRLLDVGRHPACSAQWAAACGGCKAQAPRRIQGTRHCTFYQSGNL
ncbi:hypothetical protein TREES_T100012900 [Tupaia chinensis]|uniref:Uncharacterized protein n=1 Tax=Tupaia chinensis TaxID=246437 RepID=L9L8S9_TUPCH|nr:hypothetical protein TREES_T100012900 [Tupaia chinensis]